MTTIGECIGEIVQAVAETPTPQWIVDHHVCAQCGGGLVIYEDGSGPEVRCADCGCQYTAPADVFDHMLAEARREREPGFEPVADSLDSLFG